MTRTITNNASSAGVSQSDFDNLETQVDINTDNIVTNTSSITSLENRITTDNVKIGLQAGQTNQFSGAIAIGYQAGQFNQGGISVAIGYQAGQISQSVNSVAIGKNSGGISQGVDSVAIGPFSGKIIIVSR